MADLSKFQVYNDTLRLVNATMKSHRHFIKEFKYTLGDQIVVKSLELMDLVGNGLRELFKKQILIFTPKITLKNDTTGKNRGH